MCFFAGFSGVKGTSTSLGCSSAVFRFIGVVHWLVSPLGLTD